MTILQIAVIIFALFAWSRAIIRLRGKDISIGEFLFWSLIWISVLFMALFPDIVSDFSTMLGIGRAVDLLMYISIILLFYLIFRLYVKMDYQSREMTKLVREVAIENAKQNPKKRK